uniref:SPARC related modular calcium binding 2 n=1 Tax=Sus scrofa TaxID=9823 RepID=A0A8D1AUU8_PIG
MLLPQLCWLLAALLPPAPAQKFSALTFLRVDQDKDKDCSLDCGGSAQKPLCASDGRTFLSRCEFQRAKCKDPQLEIAYRGSCKDVSRCVAERKYTQEQARKELQQVFIPECNEDGTYSQVQCHSYTGYCWCVTPNGRPISGTAVAHKTPRCPGSVNEKLPQRESTGKTDDASAPALETQPQGDEEDIASRYPTLWTEQVKSRQNKTNKNSVSSCDQEQQSALEEARQPKNDNVVIPECAHGGLYKPVQCHPSTGYCWCVLVDTGRPIPGTSTRYEQPKCDNTARAHPARTRDLYRSRQLQGCPGAKKNEFLTSVLDALSTDMVHAVSDPSSPGRLSEPDPSHTLEERVVHWYFKLLDKNSSGDVGKKEIKPFKRFLRKKSKPKKCVKRFVEYCDVNDDKSLSIQELTGCLGATKEEGRADSRKRHSAALKRRKSKTKHIVFALCTLTVNSLCRIEIFKQTALICEHGRAVASENESHTMYVSSATFPVCGCWGVCLERMRAHFLPPPRGDVAETSRPAHLLTAPALRTPPARHRGAAVLAAWLNLSWKLRGCVQVCNPRRFASCGSQGHGWACFLGFCLGRVAPRRDLAGTGSRPPGKAVFAGSKE